MKRRKFLIALGVMPPLVLEACGKDEFPSTPTILTGKVIDENDKPVEGFKMYFYNYTTKGLNSVPIFDVSTTTDKNGLYSISQTVSKGLTLFKPVGDDSTNLFSQYDIFVMKDNKYEFVGNPVGPIVYGQTNTFNFQIRKK